MKKVLVFLLVCSSFLCLSQKRNYLSFEALGSGGFGSLNFEHQLFEGNFTDVHFRSGLSFFPIDKNNGTAIVFPLMIHGIFGEKKHKLDVGIGQSLSVTTRGSLFLRMPFSVGYRIEPDEKRYYFRVSYTPIISYIYNFQWENWGGLTFGYKLTK